MKTQERRTFDLSGVTGTLDPGRGEIQLSVTRSARIPITGVRSGSYEVYGGQPISYVAVTPSSAVRVPLQ